MKIHSRQKTSQQQINKQQKSRGVRKFIFTNSTKTLARQHDNNEFVEIIGNKKIYQSMIKDELRKLQMLENCVHDPEVQSFQIPQDVNTEKINANRNKKQQKTKYQTGNTRHTSLSEKQIDIDQYLSKQMSSKCVKQVQKISKKFEYNCFIRLLILNKAHIKNKKAANYFNYERLTKKYFKMLKKSAIQETQSVSNISQSTNKLKKISLAKNLVLFKNSIVNYILKNRSKVLKKTKQFKSKKQTIQYIYNLFNFKKLCKDNNNKLDLLSKSRVLRNLILKIKYTKNIQNSCIALRKKRKHQLWMDFKNKLKQMSLKIKLNIEELVKQYQNVNGKMLLNQKDINNYCSKNKFSNQQTEEFKFKLFQYQFEDKTLKNKQSKNKKQFFMVFRQHNKLNKFNNKFLNSLQQKRKSQFFYKMRKSLQFNNKCNLIRSNRIKFYLQNFKLNSQSDNKLNQSLKNCLSGSKEWLIKNKHIFKAQPLFTTSSNPSSLNQLQSDFHHPMTHQTEIQLLKQNSIFKKCLFNHYTKAFIRTLKRNWVIKKKLQMSFFAIQSLRKQRYKKKVWQILSDKNLIKQICNEINEQMQMQMNEQQIKNQKQIEKIKTKYKLISMFNNLRQICELNNKNKQLVQNISSNRKKYFLWNIKINNQQEKRKQLSKQYTLQISTKRKYEFNYKFINLLKNNKFNANKKECIALVYQERMHNLNVSNQRGTSLQQYYDIGIKLIQSARKRKLFQLLSANKNISKQSIEITKLYLRNRIKNMRSNRKNLQENEEIYKKQQQLKNTIIKKKFIEMTIFIKQKMQIENKTTKTIQKLRKKRYTMFMKSLLQFSIDFKNMQARLKNISQLQLDLVRLAKSNFLKKFINNHANRKKKIQDQKQAIKLASISPIKNSNNQNNNKAQDCGGLSGISNMHQQDFNRLNSKSEDNKRQLHQVQSDDLLGKYLSKENLSNEKQNSNINSISKQDVIDKQNNIFEDSSKFSESPHKQGTNEKQQLEQSNQEEMSYEQYRRSALIEKNNNHNSDQQIQRNSQSQQVDQPSENNREKELQNNQQHQNDLSHDKQEQISINQQNPDSANKLHRNSKQIDKFDKSDISLNAISPEKNYHQQSSGSQDDEQPISMKTDEGNSQLFSKEYLENKYASGLIKRAFIHWKNGVFNNQQNNKIDQSSQDNHDLVTKAFEGLRMYYKQKILAKKYLKQYQQQLHYYPHSPSQYQKFKQIADQN